MDCSGLTSLKDDTSVKNKGLNRISCVDLWEKDFSNKGSVSAKALKLEHTCMTYEKGGALPLVRESIRWYGQKGNWQGGEKPYKV